MYKISTNPLVGTIKVSFFVFVPPHFIFFLRNLLLKTHQKKRKQKPK